MFDSSHLLCISANCIVEIGLCSSGVSPSFTFNFSWSWIMNRTGIHEIRICFVFIAKWKSSGREPIRSDDRRGSRPPPCKHIPGDGPGGVKRHDRRSWIDLFPNIVRHEDPSNDTLDGCGWGNPYFDIIFRYIQPTPYIVYVQLSGLADLISIFIVWRNRLVKICRICRRRRQDHHIRIKKSFSEDKYFSDHFTISYLFSYCIFRRLFRRWMAGIKCRRPDRVTQILRNIIEFIKFESSLWV